MYDSTGKRMTSQVTSGRDYSAQEAHPEIITEIPEFEQDLISDWERELVLSFPDDAVMWVCVDCYSAYHSGDYTPTEDTTPFSGFDLSDGAPAIHRYVTSGMSSFWCGCDDGLGDSDEHMERCETLDFSSKSCGACGTFLAGSRHAMTYDARYIR